MLNRLNPIHNEALRIATGAFRSTPIEALLTEANSPSLEDHHKELCLRYLFRLQSNRDYNNLNVLDSQQDVLYFDRDTLPKPVGIRARNIVQSTTMTAEPIQELIIAVPPWTLPGIEVCYEGSPNMQTLTSTHLRQIFLQHLCHHHYTNHIYTDGSRSEGGVGFAAVFPNSTIKGTLPPEASIFSAELFAIKAALSKIETSEDQKWTIFSDSKSSLEAIEAYNPTHPIVKSIQLQINNLHGQGKTIVLCKVPAHVNITGNEKADQAAKLSINLPGFHTTELPFTDLCNSAKSIFKERRQHCWHDSNTKL